MGFKASMIIVQHPSFTVSNEVLLGKLGFSDFNFSSDTTFEECMYPNDKSVNIGHYNNCIVISDDYQLTTALETSTSQQELSDYEKKLTELFPGSEILTIACHSAMNYHLYSLVKDGQKLRFKKVVHGEPLLEYGEQLEEEKKVYQYSKMIDGQVLFRSPYQEDDIYDNTEDQMMEEFSFGVAKRHLGVMISTDDDEELMFETLFKKYLRSNSVDKRTSLEQTKAQTNKTKSSWFAKLFKKS